MSASTALVRVPQPATSALTTAAARAEGYFKATQAANTRRAYASDWKHFSAWCRAAGQGSLPAAPETVVLYLSTLAETAKVSTLTRRISAISQAHQAAGFDSPRMVKIFDRTIQRQITYDVRSPCKTTNGRGCWPL